MLQNNEAVEYSDVEDGEDYDEAMNNAEHLATGGTV